MYHWKGKLETEGFLIVYIPSNGLPVIFINKKISQQQTDEMSKFV